MAFNRVGPPVTHTYGEAYTLANGIGARAPHKLKLRLRTVKHAKQIESFFINIGSELGAHVFNTHIYGTYTYNRTQRLSQYYYWVVIHFITNNLETGSRTALYL